MPLYEFKCTKCNKLFTKLCAMGETGEKIVCPKCNTAKPLRIMSGFSSPGVKQADGNSVGRPSAGGSCGGCTASSCSGCGH